MTGIVCADVLDWAKEYGGPKFHALLCDPPYELGFMGKDWDQSGVAFQPDTWAALAEHLHPGAFGMAFASARGWHRLAVAIEDAGLRIHPSIFLWNYATGFPKSTRIRWRCECGGSEQAPQHRMRLMRGADLQEAAPTSGATGQVLQSGLPESSISTYRAEGAESQLAGGKQSGVERWSDIPQSEGQLPKLQDQVCAVPDASSEHGPEGRLCDGASPPDGGNGGQDTDKARDGASQEPQPRGQQAGESGIMADEQGAQDGGGEQVCARCGKPIVEDDCWAGHRYGLQALKPAAEPVIVFQKPYEGKPVECITETGAGALWIDGGRIGTGEAIATHHGTGRGVAMQGNAEENWPTPYQKGDAGLQNTQANGRWPANFVLVHHPECRRVGERRVGSGERRKAQPGNQPFAVDRGWNQHSMMRDGASAPESYGAEIIAAWECADGCPVKALGEQSGERPSGGGIKAPKKNKPYGNERVWSVSETKGQGQAGIGGDTGTAARFFFQAAYNLEHADPVMYCAKASRKERDAGLEEWPERIAGFQSNQTKAEIKRGNDNPIQAINHSQGRKGNVPKRRNTHPTIKPLALAQWLATLLLPPEEYAPRRILIPFAGSGSEGIGAGLAGWDEMTLIEMDAETCEIAEARLAHWLNEPQQLELIAG